MCFVPGCPRGKPTLLVSFSSPPNSKPPIPHLNVKYLMLSKSLILAGNLASWGVLCGPLRILHPLWQGKGPFLRLLRLTSASGYKHYKCYISMLQCQIWGKGTENAGEWKALTQGTKGKKRKFCRSNTCFEFNPGFSSQSCCQFICIKLNLSGAIRWPV